MRALVTGADGQLARELISNAPSGATLRAVNRAECDITELPVVERVFKAFQPDIVINTAAYTAVDAAEDNEESAFDVNARGAENVAKAARLVGARLIHISTDYVFDGCTSTPYAPDSPTNPLNAYGRTKLKGEQLVLKAAPATAIIRAGWLYSTRGRNFVVSILRGLREGRALSVVVDQVGCPTSAYEFANAIWKARRASLQGIYHWANRGSGSWLDFAREIRRIALQLRMVPEGPEIRPITSGEYKSRATRPGYSVLDPTKLSAAIAVAPSAWQDQLERDITRGLK